MKFLTQTGTYILGTEYRNQNIEFGVLVVYPQKYQSEKIGQWHLTCRTFNFSKSTNIDNNMQQIFINMACRLGLMPIHFLKRFEEALLSIEPICLVADTSSLFNGSLEQALRLRSGKPTHLAIPDQVYMEIQRQRESKPVSKKRQKTPGTSDNPTQTEKATQTEKEIIQDHLLPESYSHNLQISTVRALRRIEKQSGLIVHTVRPPEAMVRYFGSERGSAIDDEDKRIASDGPNYHRDRLILEAVRNQRVLLPNIPVWLVTGDANFAIQADVEGFQVGYSWLPSRPNVRMITSPYIEARTLRPSHLHVDVFLEEWLWYWKNITLQLSGETKRDIWTLPEKRERFRLELNDLGSECIKKENKSCPRRSAAQVLNSLPASKIPLKAPLPDKLLDGLQALADIENKSTTITSDLESYLQSLKWVQKEDKAMTLTAKGKDLITRWNQLNREKVIEWCEWIRDAGQDILGLEPQKQFQKALPTLGSKGKDELARNLGISKGNVDSQSILANAFGIGVRLNSQSWKSPWKTQEEAADLILNTTRQLKDNTSSAVRVGKVFTTLLNSTPLSLANFRLGLCELVRSGKIEVNGTSPEKNIKIKVLIPNEGLQEIDLGAGDFLIPGKSCQFITLEKEV